MRQMFFHNYNLVTWLQEKCGRVYNMTNRKDVNCKHVLGIWCTEKSAVHEIGV